MDLKLRTKHAFSSARQVFLVLLAGLLISACNQNPLIVEFTDCPGVGFVRYANTITGIAAGAPATARNVEFQAHLTGLDVDCRDKGEGVRTRIEFTIAAETGPAYETGALDVPYFVAIAIDGDNLRSKEIYTARVYLEGQPIARGRTRQTLEFTIPTDELADQDVYEVLIGFQLTNDQARYNLLS